MRISKDNPVKRFWDLLRDAGVEDLDEDLFGKLAIFCEEEVELSCEGGIDEEAKGEAAKKADGSEE